MGALQKTMQALAGLILAAALAAAVSTWAFPAENDLLYSAGPVRFGVTGAGAGLSLLTALAFAGGRIHVRRKDESGNERTGSFADGFGFGLLPGLAVWKCFEEHTVLGKGTRIPEGVVSLPWFTADGISRPCRLEAFLALLLFAALIVWLALRSEPLRNGDVFGTAAAMWGACRLVTDGFRAEQLPWMGEARITGWLSAGLMLAALAVWTARTFRKRKNTGYAFVCVPVFAASVALAAMVRNEIILADNPPARLVLTVCGALLALKAALCMGRVSR